MISASTKTKHVFTSAYLTSCRSEQVRGHILRSTFRAWS